MPALLTCPHCSFELKQLLTTCPGCERDLSLRGIRLAGQALEGAHLEGLDLRDAVLSGARLAQAQLGRADLRGAALDGADLRGADLTEADLSGADLSLANLSGAVLHKTKVVKANLHRAAVDRVYAGVLRKFEGTPAWGADQPSTSEPAQYLVPGGEPITCHVCGADRFVAQQVLLNTRGLTFLGLDWLNQAASLLVCARCSHIEWFAKPPQLRVSPP